MYCKNCGALVEPEDTFCPCCGNKVRQTSATTHSLLKEGGSILRQVIFLFIGHTLLIASLICCVMIELGDYTMLIIPEFICFILSAVSILLSKTRREVLIGEAIILLIVGIVAILVTAFILKSPQLALCSLALTGFSLFLLIVVDFLYGKY